MKDDEKDTLLYKEYSPEELLDYKKLGDKLAKDYEQTLRSQGVKTHMELFVTHEALELQWSSP